MTLYLLGPLSIRIAPFNVSDVSRSGETDYAVKPILDVEQPGLSTGS